jgi:hypothetical protein
LVATKAFAVDGNSSVTLCIGYCTITWDTTRKYAFVSVNKLDAVNSYLLPLKPDLGLPQLPAGGIVRIEDFTKAKSIERIPHLISAAASQLTYAYQRQTTRRNLYRIPLQ